MGEGDLTGASAIRRLRVVHAIPTSAPDPVGLQATVSASVGDPLRHALETRLMALQERDPQAIWVIRELEVDVPLPLSLRDPPALAARVAMAVELAIRQSMQQGQGATCVRFDSSASYVAAFVEATMNRAADGWVFDRLTPARGLAPAAAMLVAARLTDADLLEVVTEMARAGVWRRFVSALTPADADRLTASIHQARPAVAVSGETVRRVREVSSDGVHISTLCPAASRLATLGHVLRALNEEPGLVAAVLSPPLSGWSPRAEPQPPNPRPTTRSTPSRSEWPSIEEGTTFRAAGAAAFIVATSIADVAEDLDFEWLVADDDLPAAIRREMLARVLGIDAADPGVGLAAGSLARGADLRVDLGDLHVDVDLPDADREWLRAADSPPVEVALAHRLARMFLRRLVGFHTSPLAYIVPRLFGAAGTIAVDVNAISVDIERPPLLVVLQIAGLADSVTTLPWLPQPVIIRHEASR